MAEYDEHGCKIQKYATEQAFGDMDFRVVTLENKVAELEGVVKALIEQFLPPITQRIKALESVPAHTVPHIQPEQNSTVERDFLTVQPTPAARENTKAGLTKKRQQTTYDVYCKVVALQKEGMAIADIAKHLNLPYATVRVYLNWGPETIEKKRTDWVKKHGPVDEPIEAEEDASVFDMAEVREYTTNPEVVNNPAYGPVNAVVWADWTEAQKQQALLEQDENGFPLNVPFCPSDEVFVEYATGGYSNQRAASTIDWARTDIKRWRFA